MMRFGEFWVDAWTDGCPIWCHMAYRDSLPIQFSEDEIPHLEAAVAELRRRVKRTKKGRAGR
jgi:hypothetical protein